MQDGTVKQINPFTGAEVWSVPGRRSKPNGNGIEKQQPKILEKHSPEDYCSFCVARYNEIPPEKSRLILQNGQYIFLPEVFPENYYDTFAIFRRTPNLFEIVTLDYWRKNFGYRMSAKHYQSQARFLANSSGKNHVLVILNYKLRQLGKTEHEIAAMPEEEKLLLADAFFGGGHDLVVAGKHYTDAATDESHLYSSGEMSPDEHCRYFMFTILAMQDIIAGNRYVQYISVFQNWLKPAGASFDHLHKQLVALDDWGSSIHSQTKMLRKNPNVFNEYGANLASKLNLMIAENDYAIAFVGIGHRFPTIEICSRSVAGRPFNHSDEEVRGVSDLVHAIHCAMGNTISCNEEWYYTPIDSVDKMPWHILIKWRINIAAGFEGGTGIYLNPMTPVELRDKIVPHLYRVRDEGKINACRIAEECNIHPNPLNYYLRS
jgi:galactose-1-phosphate uridylyltransferase